VLACGLYLNLTSERVMLIGVLNLNWLTLSLYIFGVKLFDGYPLNPLYLWVDQIWGYNKIIGSA
jgi:hypothetical protein